MLEENRQESKGNNKERRPRACGVEGRGPTQADEVATNLGEPSWKERGTVVREGSPEARPTAEEKEETKESLLTMENRD